MAFGAGAPECGIDANSEQGFTVYFTGGNLLAVGGGNSVPTTSASNQAYVSCNLSASANTVIAVKSGSTELASFTVPAEYGSTLSVTRPGGGPGGGCQGGAMLITAEGLSSGTSYIITCGSSTTTATAKQ